MMMLAAAIQDVLSEGMITGEAVSCWWGAPRAELGGRSPFDLVMANAEGAGQRLLDLARGDVLDAALADQRAEELLRGWADR